MPRVIPLARIDYVREAERMYTAYLKTQTQILAFEREALKAAKGEKMAASYLLNPRAVTPESYTYQSLCGDRDQYMARAQLAASMAIMLGQR